MGANPTGPTIYYIDRTIKHLYWYFVNDKIKDVSLKLLEEAFQDEIAHLKLRRIRDTQAPRFEALKKTHPEIHADFMKARTGPHEVLLKNRRKRVKILTDIIEGKYD